MLFLYGRMSRRRDGARHGKGREIGLAREMARERVDTERQEVWFADHDNERMEMKRPLDTNFKSTYPMSLHNLLVLLIWWKPEEKIVYLHVFITKKTS